jgi:hypothetical protein
MRVTTCIQTLIGRHLRLESSQLVFVHAVGPYPLRASLYLLRQGRHPSQNLKPPAGWILQVFFSRLVLLRTWLPGYIEMVSITAIMFVGIQSYVYSVPFAPL